MLSDQASTAGRCPGCDTELLDFDVLIEYERVDGERDAFAECPNCRRVVHPA